MKKKIALIIGGGPAGLTAAYEFLEHTDIQPIVVELSNSWGGISRTIDFKGNKIDIGGHRFFSKSDRVMSWWNNIMPILSEQKEIKIAYQNQTKNIQIHNNQTADSENVMLVRNRKSRIYFNKKFFDYPVSLTPSTVGKIGYLSTVLIGLSYMKSVIFPIKNEVTLEDFFINRFGKKLYKTFFKDYTEKVWGVPCHEISAEWGAQRIKGLSILKTISHYFNGLFKSKNQDINQKNTETSLIEYFLYPKFGPGQMWEQVADRILKSGGELIQNHRVIKININDNKVDNVIITDKVGNEKSIICDYCISTMPVNELIQSMSCDIPENVAEVSSGLLYRDFITVGLLLKKIKYEVEDNWIYIQEPYVNVGRLQIFNNWSPFLVKDKNTKWVGLEYFCNKNDFIWNKSDEEMKQMAIAEMIEMGFIDSEDFIDAVVIKVPKTYPAYFGSYNRFDEIKDFTNKIKNLFLVGRNGMHKYNNQDHSMLTAMQAVENIKNGVVDKTNIWEINTEQEYHEEK